MYKTFIDTYKYKHISYNTQAHMHLYIYYAHILYIPN